MWPQTEARGELAARESAAAAPAPARDMPAIAAMNIHNSNGFHFGPKFVTVSQTVHNNEVIKGGCLGLELVSPRAGRRLRCGVAVCVCWALVVAAGLAAYLAVVVLFRQSHLDIELPLAGYLCELARHSSRAERLACAAAAAALVACAALLVYYTAFAHSTEDPPDIAPDEWNITREQWLAREWPQEALPARAEPLRLVVVQHSVSNECHSFARCASELRTLQAYFIDHRDRDIPYNFIVGNDGRVYEVRGWGAEGAHTKGYNRCALGLGFIGDYREEKEPHSRVTARQLAAALRLLAAGAAAGRLAPAYRVVGALDLQQYTQSPGSNLYKAIRQWDHFDHHNLFANKTCDEINDMLLPPLDSS